MSLTRLKVHFPSLRPQLDPIDLVKALHVGGFDGATMDAGPEARKYDDLNRAARDYFSPAEAADAQVWVFPYRAADFVDECRQLADAARESGAGFMCMSWGDGDEPIDLPHGTVYRHSMFADSRLACEAAMPAFVSDLQAEIGRPLEPRAKAAGPEVGFCGFVATAGQRLVYRLTGRSRKADGPALRVKAIKALRRPGIEANVILRSAYWAGAKGRFRRDPARQFKPREEFIGNVLGTAYTLCVRGAGNFSYRFYEVLAAGRIPVLVNTRCVLPFEGSIDWKRHCVWVEDADLGQLADRLLAFHNQLSAEQFVTLQADNRRLWEQWLSPLSFYRHALGRAARTET